MADFEQNEAITSPDTSPDAAGANMSKPPQMAAAPVSPDERLARIEALLGEQAAYAKNNLRLRAVSLVLTCATTLAVAIFLIVFGTSAYRMTQDVSRLTQTAQSSLNSLTDSFSTIADGIDQIDFDAVSKSFEELQLGLAEVDFEALADSIEHLQDVAARLAKVTSIFG